MFHQDFPLENWLAKQRSSKVSSPGAASATSFRLRPASCLVETRGTSDGKKTKTLPPSQHLVKTCHLKFAIFDMSGFQTDLFGSKYLRLCVCTRSMTKTAHKHTQ